MDLPTGETAALLGETVRTVRERRLTFLAGSLAYNAFVSLVPFLILLFLVAGAVGDEVLTDRIEASTQAFLTPEAQDLITDALTNAGGQTGLSAVGLLVTLWGALKPFRGLNAAFAEVYGRSGDVTFLGELRDGVVAFAAVGLSLFAVSVAGGAFAYFDFALLYVLNPVLLLAGLSAAFLPLYYVFPDVELGLREALPGSVVAAGGWALLEMGFQMYAAAVRYEAYGVIGGVLLLLMWLYFGGLVLLVGAAVNAVIRERRDRTAESTSPPATPRERSSPSNDDEGFRPRTEASPPVPTASTGSERSERPVERDAVRRRRGSRSTSETRSEHERFRSFALGVGVCGCVAVLGVALRRRAR